MKNKYLLYILLLFYTVNTAIAQVGIGTNSPNPNSLLDLNSTNKGFLLPQLELEAKSLANPLSMHIEGVWVYNTQSAGTGDDAVRPGLYYNDGTTWVAMASDTKKIGDVKYGFQTGDHNGWYLMNGRSVASLADLPEAAAIALGYGSNLPNATNRFVKSKPTTEAMGLVGGGSVQLTRANLPNITFAGTTNTTGNHTHTYTDNTSATATSVAGTNNPLSNGGNGNFSTSTTGAHFHTATVPSGGSGTAINYVPQFISANLFIYLGN